jgi:hypothetical protein
MAVTCLGDAAAVMRAVRRGNVGIVVDALLTIAPTASRTTCRTTLSTGAWPKSAMPHHAWASVLRPSITSAPQTADATIPPKVECELTELGQLLIEPLRTLAAWAQANRPAI